MVPFTYDLTLTLNKKSKVDVIYIAFAKAFDSVSHNIIIKKLNNKLLLKEQCDKIASKGNSNYAHMPFYYEQQQKQLSILQS